MHSRHATLTGPLAAKPLWATLLGSMLALTGMAVPYYLYYLNTHPISFRLPDGPGITVPEVVITGSKHIPPGSSHPPYTSDPPTSGYHWPFTTQPGIYATPLPQELQVHNLEHGHIIIQYNCDCPELVDKLKAFVGSQKGKALILAPYPHMSYRLALTAWGRLLPLQDYDEQQMTAFLIAYLNRGPE